MIVGIDLGTTNSVVAFYSEDGPKLIPNALGDFLTPSVVGINRDGQVVVGKTARELMVTDPDRAAALFKRNMGADWTTTIDGNPYSAIELSALVLRSLVRDAESHLKTTIDRAVITVPAYFNEPQRSATIRAGELAGLNVERIINEPTAAAIAYGVHETEDERTILVFDLGGGTFDVSIVEWFEGALEIRSSAGETFLGGEDFTTALAAKVAARRGLTYETTELQHPRMVSRLRKQCEIAKQRLTTETQVEIRIPELDGSFKEESVTEVVTRAEFIDWTTSIFEQVDRPIRRALNDAGLTRADIDDVVLVGGATRMPFVSQHVAELFDKTPRCTLDPDEAVALGAAIQAALNENNQSVGDLVVTDVAPFSLGIEITREVGNTFRDGYFLPVLNRNTTIPASRVTSVQTLVANQTAVNVKVFQGEHRRTSDNQMIGEFRVGGIPPGPPGQVVDVRFTYDLNGVLEVDAVVVETNTGASHVVSQFAQGLSEEDLQRAVERMQVLKVHPREEAENDYLMQKSERLFAEVAGIERMELDAKLLLFEAALDSQEPNEIQNARNVLRELLERLDRGF